MESPNSQSFVGKGGSSHHQSNKHLINISNEYETDRRSNLNNSNDLFSKTHLNQGASSHSKDSGLDFLRDTQKKEVL